MSKVHIEIPGSNVGACGAVNVSHTGWTKLMITCKRCKKTENYKVLPTFKPSTKS